MNDELITYLQSFVNENRIKLLDANLEKRTRYVTIVLEDIYQPHNANAILRTCDCFGIQDIHIIENRNKYAPNDQIALGAEQWLSIYKYNKSDNNTREALQNLKANGYQIVATSLKNKSTSLDNLNLQQGKIAVVLGTELTGISKEVEELADGFLHIPMFGFTESLNISVATAIIVQNLTFRLRQSDIHWQLSDNEKKELKIKWLKNSIKKADMIEKYFHTERSKNIDKGL